MKKISGKELKQLRHEFWISKKHALLPEAPVVGGKESTAMFTIAGMQQLIPYLAGKPHPLGKRLFNIQKCIRTVDIDEVGDMSHLTFFEMMGNRSLGDYFKKDAVQRSWEFLVEKLGFDPKKLAATVFEGNDEVSKDIETIGYRTAAGLDESRVCALGAKDNRRSPGPVGPCGPCTEIYYWVGETEYPSKGSTPATDEKNWLEIRNNVFMEYYRDDTGKLTKLKEQNVDTGMGFERMCKVIQDKASVYETDVFSSLLGIISHHIGVKYEANERRLRIIADHLRTACFMVKDGITPSNEGRGYVLRRLIRRTYYNWILINPITEEKFQIFLHEFGEKINEIFSVSYEVKSIMAVIQKEAHQFQKTITNGQKLLQELFAKQSKQKAIAGADAFKLYDTCGFPLELTVELATEKGFTVDTQGFQKEMEAQQTRSRAGSKDMFKIDIDWSKYLEGVKPTQFIGYKTLQSEDMNLIKDFDVQGQRVLIFDKTPLYAESGGQMGDKGILILDSGEIVQIKDVKKYEGVFLHFVG